ncbi:hypothetical protein HUJ04_002963 [Dendroctonus ponderosae]|nr:hypothetical protein HUJ04_002963 [Dendroctonus ponderosae]KAH1024040.1 hypothetical protein HUJ05_003604 [Dendroctonus ponderosae]
MLRLPPKRKILTSKQASKPKKNKWGASYEHTGARSRPIPIVGISKSIAYIVQKDPCLENIKRIINDYVNGFINH